MVAWGSCSRCCSSGWLSHVPLASFGHAARAQDSLQRDAAVAVQPGLGVLLAHAGLSQDDGPGRAEDDGVVGALVRDPLVGVAHLGGLPPPEPATGASVR